MRTTTNIVSLLLVDIRLGGPGASDMSDWLVKQKLAQTVSIITSAVHRHGGIVATRFGQTLLCTFPKVPAAVAAASEIIGTNAGAAEDGVTGSGRRVDLRLVMNHGRMVVAAGNISGEVVDEVGLLVETVEPNTIVATQAVIDALPEAGRAGWRDLGERPIDGLAKSLHRYQLADGAAVAKPAAAPPPKPAPAPPKPVAVPTKPAIAPPKPAPEPPAPVVPPRATVARLTMAGRTWEVDAEHPVLTLGRHKDNDVVVGESHVSRRHATIEFRLDGFYLVNGSVNGTTVVLEGLERTVGENEALRLPPTGQIALAPTILLTSHAEIHFDIT